ncbi:divergent polysaccharide deacetylase family protein [Volucribacter amazonae]|uniref:Divergent polysaccharide deacetylase n=1 Tax=Volucribacter amazonae TaxID=256731 RepID=A0A9X4PD98_9PAST|nr:divergent polysaccharide deacetylase family protein [Volucribacter amazonae]MDG6895441.1 hypothetical protein [Volucribacter amazonae]
MSKKIIQSAVAFGFFFLTFIPQLYAGKLAIVIDDIGYRQREDSAIYALPPQISVAIIPSAPYAKQRNQLAYQQGRDILIHLPMQAKNNMKLEPGGLYLGMNQSEVEQRVAKAKEIVSYAIGLNNHTGSAATSNAPLMDYLMQALQQHHLFFLDSRTIGSSVASKIARQRGINALDRDIFLDDSDQLADVERQFQRAIQYARKQGKAIVIGHPRPNTIKVLQAGLRQLPPDIQLVSIGSLWHNEKVTPAKPFILLFSDQAAPTSTAPFAPVVGLRGMPQ